VKKSFRVRLVHDGSMCFIPVPFDPRPVFGKLRAPVRVTLSGYTYRSTIASMGDGPCLPLRRSHREAAKLNGDELLTVTLELDTDERKVELPADFARALRANAAARARFQGLSFSHQREHVEAILSAKKPETRARRITKALAALGASQTSKLAAGVPRLNATWHQRHPMPKPATQKQRLAWHLAHAKHCACRPMPAGLRALAKRA
jgi:hypothetical protein